MDLVEQADHRVKTKENEKGVKYLNLARELKKAIEQESDSDTNYNWCAMNDLQNLTRELVLYN